MCLQRGHFVCGNFQIWRNHYHHWHFLKRYGDTIFFIKREDYSRKEPPYQVHLLYDSIYENLNKINYPNINKNTMKIHHRYVLKLFKMFYVENYEIKNENIEQLKGILQKHRIKK